VEQPRGLFTISPNSLSRKISQKKDPVFHYWVLAIDAGWRDNLCDAIHGFPRWGGKPFFPSF
jgi:hypothetical protein